MSDPNTAALSSISGYLFWAIIVNIIAILVSLFTFLLLAGLDLIWLVGGIAVLIRIRSTRKAAERNDIAKLKTMASTGWAIAGFIFTGIIPGILMSMTDGKIKQLVVPSMPIASSTAGTTIPGQLATQQTGDFKYCVSCGTQISRRASFCPSCGANQN